MFYLDGAHSPESMEVCAKWFSLAVKEENQPQNWCNQQGGDSKSANTMLGNNYGKSSGKISTQVELIDFVLHLFLVLMRRKDG